MAENSLESAASASAVDTQEISALRALVDAFEPLSEDECRRILEWAFQRFVEDPATARAEAVTRERNERIEAAREARRLARERRSNLAPPSPEQEQP